MPEEQQTEQAQDVEQQQESGADAQEAAGQEEPFDAERAQAKIRKVNSEAESLRRRLKELEPLAAEAQALRDAQKSAEERAAERAEAAEKRAASAQARAVRAEVKSLAAAGFADPDDAVGALDLADYADADGEIDTDRIKSDLDDLLKRKPHWGRPDEGGPRRPAPDRTQGSSGNGARTPTDPATEFAGFMNRALNRGR
ncbi:hypothetical protein [Kitasatospora phosalacinea]|uniref:Uncharacterized protein n=1 Tax=Kitasatospora phosalacinea TaxID=2065 RepID=A0ABW6GRX4_9ACTN